VGKQLKVTFTDAEVELVEELGALLGSTDSDVIQLGFRFGLKKLMEYVESVKRRPVVAPHPGGIKTLLTRLVAGEWISDCEIVEAAYALDIDEETLIALRDRLGRKNGDSNQTQQRST
jgi:hypothetical protein